MFNCCIFGFEMNSQDCPNQRIIDGNDLFDNPHKKTKPIIQQRNPLLMEPTVETPFTFLVQLS